MAFLIEPLAKALRRTRKSLQKRLGRKDELATIVFEKGGALSFNPQHPSFTRLYYLYCVKLLEEAMKSRQPRVHAVVGGYRINPPHGLPPFRVALQIEHTLVKPGGRDGEGAPLSPIAVDDRRYLVRLDRLRELETAEAIIEYSAPNVVHVRESGLFAPISAKTHLIAPLLYELCEPDASEQRDLDTITLFGNPEEPRRKDFLQRLAAHGVRSQNITGVFDGVEQIYRRARIVINIRQTDHHDTLEELRVLPALLSGAIVVSERAPLTQHCGYADHIVWGSLDELPELIREVQERYPYYRERIFADGRLRAAVAALNTSNRASARAIVERMVQTGAKERAV
jgi:hypothetical protein